MHRLIFGCGYLGEPAARSWLARGDRVTVVTRSTSRAEELKADGFDAIVADITDPDSLVGLPTAETVLMSVGMDRVRYQDIRQVYVDGFKNVLERLPEETGHLIYISSTGVYGDTAGQWVTERTKEAPQRPGGQACLEAEQRLLESPFADRQNILRMAGLYGPGRVPSWNWVQERRWDQLRPSGHLNLIHQTDAVAAILAVAKIKPFQELFLVADGQPVHRRAYYQALAEQLGIGAIPWQETATGVKTTDKRISNQKMLEHLKITLSYPDFQQGLEDAINPSN